MKLYPRLPRSVARALAAQYALVAVRELVTLSSVSHRAAIFAPTGGQRADLALLGEIQREIRVAAELSGYPDTSDEGSRRRFDGRSGQLLHEMLDMSPAEASHESVWAFFGCVLLPDVVRWRFGFQPSPTSEERFVGGFRGLRNTFGRVWWRAWILHEPGSPTPYRLLGALGEDELVQITERPNLAGNPPLARQVCRTFMAAIGQYPHVPRSDLLRDSMKRLRRLLPLVSFDALDPELLELTIDEVFTEAGRALTPEQLSVDSGGVRRSTRLRTVRDRLGGLIHR
jgi:Family of unknown function (DUF6339)